MGDDMSRSEVFRDYVRTPETPDRADGVVQLVPTQSDEQRAAMIRLEITGTLEAVCRAVNAAKSEGFTVSFQLQPDGLGRHFISQLVIAKHF